MAKKKRSIKKQSKPIQKKKRQVTKKKVQTGHSPKPRRSKSRFTAADTTPTITPEPKTNSPH
jgi:hypothetical protein